MADDPLADQRRASLHDSFYFPDPEKLPPLIVTDWDLHDVPLHGLDYSKTPSLARDAQVKGSIRPLEEDAVKFEIKTLAVVMCNHQREATVWNRSVLNGRNTIAYHMLSLFAPGPITPERKGRNLARLQSSRPLPLEQWEKLYYICVAEVRRLYADLRIRFGKEFGNGGILLHHAGPDADRPTERLPWSAVAMASLLEDMWMTLHDPRILSALDKAVRERQAAELVNDMSTHHNVKSLIETTDMLVNAMEGVKDTSDMAPADIINMVWLMEAAEIRRKARQGIKDISVVAIAAIEIREAAPCDRDGRVRPTSSKAKCICGPTCHCKSRCAQRIDDCTCTKYRYSVRNLILQHYGIHDAVPKRHDTNKAIKVSETPSVTPEEETPMQVVHDGKAHDLIVRALYSTGEEADRLDKQFLEDMRLRDRSATGNSSLAYIPEPQTPSRAPKDAVPLGFYGESSRQRYPPTRSQMKSQPPPVYGSSAYSTQVPPRKPVPASLTASATSSSDPFNDMVADSSPLDARPVIYPAIPKSQSEGLFTQSFPRAKVGNPRVKETDTGVSAAEYHDLASEAHATFRPFEEHNYEPHPQLPDTQQYHHRQDSQPETIGISTRPMFHATTTAPVGMAVGIAQGRGYTATSEPPGINSRPNSVDIFAKAQPPRSDPAFIAPRPAIRQRYVSAGGHAKLHEREEIEVPFMQVQSSGAGMHKDELFQALENPEFIKRAFGDAALANSTGTFDARRSEDSSYGTGIFSSFADQRVSGQSPGGKRRGSGGLGLLSSKRESREDELIKAEKRERTQSASSTGSNGRFEKLKRVFSKKSSDCE